MCVLLVVATVPVNGRAFLSNRYVFETSWHACFGLCKQVGLVQEGYALDQAFRGGMHMYASVGECGMHTHCHRRFGQWSRVHYDCRRDEQPAWPLAT